MSALRLAVFDCDGTLIDSLAAIVTAMQAAFADEGLDIPDERAIRQIVGLSVPEAVLALAQEHTPDIRSGLDRKFRQHSVRLRHSGGDTSVLFGGAREALDRLEQRGVLMAVATGKARRGLKHTLDHHALASYFVATQTADDALSKPHPQMLEACERMTGVARQEMVMIGDTTFDIDMARAFGCPSIGVSWGYHEASVLSAAGADTVIDRFDQLEDALLAAWDG